jgi:hypothetical protein
MEEQRPNGSKPNVSGLPLNDNKINPIGKAKIKPINDGDYLLIDGIAALIIRFVVLPGENSRSTVVGVKAYAVVDGYQAELEPPIGGSTSSVLCWISPDGEKIKGSQRINIPNDKQGEWQVIISAPEDIMLGIDFTAEAMESL